ncbi:hypothetical protein [Micromonospora globbae]|uniref:hypothetical protein n=1 Tax=Micromonospora globbae TaxID=1894969 RepID=UPI003447086E
MTETPYTEEQVRAGADALVRLRTQAPSLDGLEPAEREYWLADARAVLEAAGGPVCPCTCHQPDRCPCAPGTPDHKHGAGGYCTVGEPVDQADNAAPLGADVTVTIERPDDEEIEVHVDGQVVASANHDDHGWSGMDAVERTALAVARACGARVDQAEG